MACDDVWSAEAKATMPILYFFLAGADEADEPVELSDPLESLSPQPAAASRHPPARTAAPNFRSCMRFSSPSGARRPAHRPVGDGGVHARCGRRHGGARPVTSS